MKHIDASGIRKAFEMAKAMKDPINLSIGLPDFDVPDPVKAAAIAAIEEGHNAYTVTQGIPELRGKLQAAVDAQFGHADRQVLITAGTSGGLLLGLCCAVNPGDEVIIFDPYFGMYRHLATLAGGVSVLVNTYPDFRSDAARVEAVLTERTKCVVVNTPANPTGIVAHADEVRALAGLCRERGILLISDEVYRAFCYDHPFASPASWNEDVLVVNGFSKTYGMTGWRLGYAHGPARLIQEMAKLQQFSFVCAEHGAVCRRRGTGSGPDGPDRRLPQEARHGRGGAGRGFRARAPGRGLLRLSPSPLGHRQRVRGRSHQVRPADHPRQRLLPARHALPHLLRRRRRDPPPRARPAAQLARSRAD